MPTSIVNTPMGNSSLTRSPTCLIIATSLISHSERRGLSPPSLDARLSRTLRPAGINPLVSTQPVQAFSTAKRLHNAVFTPKGLQSTAQGRGTPRTLGKTMPPHPSTPKGLHSHRHNVVPPLQ